MPEQEFIALALSSRTITDLCVRLGLSGAYGNGFWAIRSRCEGLGLLDHFAKDKRRKRDIFLTPIESMTDRNALIQRIKRDNLIPHHQCAKCENDGVWLGKRLALQLHHKNGIASDHRLDNVEFLCPNCHSQTETWTGRNAKRKP